jgi:peptide deformylase
MSGFAPHSYKEIVTCDDDPTRVLRQTTTFIAEKEWGLVQPTVDKLLYVRNEILKGGAGLAAPQIGISLPIFIYTPDRTTENLRYVINPSFQAIGNKKINGSEACFSVPLRCTTLPRWEKINVRYQNLDARWIEEEVHGFEAKVFQHEMDHLMGKLTIDHASADVATFTNPDVFQSYMQQIHREDSKTYKK